MNIYKDTRLAYWDLQDISERTGHSDIHCSSVERLELTYRCSVFPVKIILKL